MPSDPDNQPVDKRQLAAILAADIVGYSKMMEQDERETLKRLRDFRSGLLQPIVAEHHGRIFKTMGDGFLVEFSSVVDAVHCAVDIQRALTARNLDLPEPQKLLLRIGVNLGDVFHEGEDVFGDGVNIAARLEALAPPGGICVSRGVRDQVRERLNFDFADLGEYRVKNIARPIEVFGIAIDGAQAKAPEASRTLPSPARSRLRVMGTGLAIALCLGALYFLAPRLGLTPSARRPAAWSEGDRRMSFAVLPFASTDSAGKSGEISAVFSADLPALLTEYVSAGWVLSKEQISSSNLSGSPQQVGARLNVEFVIQGTARLDNDAILVQANLIEVSSGKIVGTEKLRCPLTRSSRSTEDYASILADELIQDALRAEAQRLAFLPEPQWDARDWMISKWARGETASKEFYLDSLRRAQRALALAPDNPHVVAETGEGYALLVALGYSDDPDGDRRRAEELLRKALNMDSNSPSAWMGMSFLYDIDSDWENAAMADEKVLAQWPHNVSLKQNLAGDYANLGREKEAIDLINQKPAENFNFYDYSNLGYAYFVLGDLPAAEKNFQRARAFYRPAELATNLVAGQNEASLASTLALMGRLDEARTVLQRIADVPSLASVSAVAKSLGKRTPPGTDRLLEGLRKAGLRE